MSYTETSNLANFRMHSDYLLIFGEDNQFYCYGCRSMDEVYEKLTDRIYEEIEFQNQISEDLGEDPYDSPYSDLYDAVDDIGYPINDTSLITEIYRRMFAADRNFMVIDQQCRVVFKYSAYE